MLLQGALHYRADQGVTGGRVLKDLLSSEQRPRDSFLEVSFGVSGHLYRAIQAETRWPHRSGSLLFVVFLFLSESLTHSGGKKTNKQLLIYILKHLNSCKHKFSSCGRFLPIFLGQFALHSVFPPFPLSHQCPAPTVR